MFTEINKIITRIEAALAILASAGRFEKLPKIKPMINTIQAINNILNKIRGNQNISFVFNCYQ